VFYNLVPTGRIARICTVAVYIIYGKN